MLFHILNGDKNEKTDSRSDIFFIATFIIIGILILTLVKTDDKAHAGACATGDQSGTISVDTVWCAVYSPYNVTSNVIVAQGITLTIEPGVTVRVKTPVQGSGRIIVNGTLRAIGTSTTPITFTSGQVTPAPRDWEFISFTSTSSNNVIEYATLEYGGAGGWVGVIEVATSSLEIRNSTLTKNYQFGIRVKTEQPMITHNNIYGNGADVGDWEGVMNETGTAIDAFCNYWGDPTGPKHPSNPFGNGDPVGDEVNFIPWLVSPAPAGACVGRPKQIFLPVVLR